MVTIASRGPGSGSVDLAVGDGDTVGGTRTKDDVLTGNQVGGDVVNPDKIRVVDGDGITTPDVSRVDLRETDVLDDDVLRAAHNADTLSSDHTLASLTNQTLV